MAMSNSSNIYLLNVRVKHDSPRDVYMQEKDIFSIPHFVGKG
jgi:hypothetical protein